MLSPPTWRCGLKLIKNLSFTLVSPVTSHVEVWIETVKLRDCNLCTFVTSHVEVWIETAIAA